MVLGAASCRPDGTSATRAPLAPGEGRPGVGPAEPVEAPLPAAQLQGRIIALAAGEDGAGNVAHAIDPVSGHATELWQIERGTTVSEWRVSPDGRRVAYRRTKDDGSAREALVVRDLATGATPVTLAVMDISDARLAGFVWSPDGKALAFGREVGAASSREPAAASARGWELHVVAADVTAGGVGGGDAAEANPAADRILCEMQGSDLGSQLPILVGWRPTARRAAVLELARDAGFGNTVRVIDTVTGEEVASLVVNVIVRGVIASPDGRLLALLEAEAEPRRVRLLDQASGVVVDVAPIPAGWVPGTPVWSPEGRWLAWTERPGADAGASGKVVVIRAARPDRIGGRLDGEALFSLELEGQGTEAVAFSPSGDVLLVAEAEPYSVEPSRLSVYRVPDGEGGPLAWAPPAGTWHIGWVSDILSGSGP